MNYGVPKVLPATGGGALFIGALSQEMTLIIALLLAVSTFGTLTALRLLWRRGKRVNER